MALTTLPAFSTAFAKRETLNLRIKSEERSLIDRAARVRGKNRTDFVLEAARAAAQEARLDQTIMTAFTEAYAAFVARLDVPRSQTSACVKPRKRRRRKMNMAIEALVP
ncbi:DUF1778 domain-containing protein [Mycetohabitans sp. B3]|uniref:type II toxin-antitoxin system TacA family antitoxin n=1 Tax=Mycetohabitans sp. B3 TaxID=2841841 RepID=UPI0027BADC8B|nr:DUF1778 domain-containing protein [Mycetohabitans sp. B3]